VDKVTKEPLKAEHSYFFAGDEINQAAPIPDASRRVRVHGGDSESAFLLEGFATYMKLNLALERTFQKSFDDFSYILDWGCGCGRMTRYFQGLKNASITGIDIDTDNIGWCQRNLPFGEFLAIPLHPPTELQAGFYDLLIGISIFTHLREKEQFEWLTELARLTADGGILLMTVHGDATIGRSNLPAPFFNELRDKGFLDIGRNPNLDGAITDEDYYRNTYHTHEYIRDRWSKHFEVIDIIPGYIGNHQDLVIMRK
jgi:SAM-dependent methyltransferase